MQRLWTGLMYFTYKEGKSAVSERFMRTLKDKNLKKVTADDIKSYLGYLNKLADEYDTSYHCSICKNRAYADYCVFSDEFESSYKVPTFKAGDRIRIMKYNNTLSKGYAEKWTNEIFFIDSLLKNHL